MKFQDFPFTAALQNLIFIAQANTGSPLIKLMHVRITIHTTLMIIAESLRRPIYVIFSIERLDSISQSLDSKCF